jgi:PAS domain S-box-containing protein
MSAAPRSEFDLLDGFPLPAWHCDPDGRCDYLNRQWLDFTGRTLEQQALGDGWAAGVHPDDLEAAMSAYREAVQARRSFALEYRLRRHDGEYRWVVAHGSVWEDAAGQFAGYLGACYDVTECKRAEEQTRFRDLLLNHVRNAVIALNLEGRVVYWNRHAETLYQWKTEEVVGKNIIELLESGDEGLLAQRILSTLLAYGYWEGEFEVRRKDGSILPTHAVDVLLKDGDGHPLGFVGVSVDITEQRRTEAQLRRQRAMLSSAVRIAGLGCWDYDLLQDRLEWADETLGIFGTTREAFGATLNAFLAFVHPDDREALQAMGARSLMDRGTVEMEYRIVRPDGEVRLVYDRGEVVFDDRGEPIRRTGVVMDITEHKQAEAALRQANEQLHVLSRRLFQIQEDERRRLARELHDQMGQALTAAKIDLQAAQRLEERNAIVGRLDDSIVMLERILQQVRQLSLELRPPLLDDLGLVPVLRWYLDQQAQRAGFRVEFFADPALERVDAAIETACFRVAQEALTNVVRHARALAVSVELHRTAEALHLVVQDNGIGFDVATALQGPSLGLLGMRERVALLGGELDCKSAPGRGTEVHAFFPGQSRPDAHDARP